MYKKGLLETMIYLAPVGTTIDFNEKGTFITYSQNFTFETAYQKLGISHRLIESSTHITHWNSHLANQIQETLKTIDEGKGKKNIGNLKLEQSEICSTYSNLIGFPELFKSTYNITIQAFLNIICEFIFECYPNDNTLGIWSIAELGKSAISEKYDIEDVRRVISIFVKS